LTKNVPNSAVYRFNSIFTRKHRKPLKKRKIQNFVNF